MATPRLVPPDHLGRARRGPRPHTPCIAVAGALLVALVSIASLAGHIQDHPASDGWQPLMQAVHDYIALRQDVTRRIGGPVVSRDARATLAALDALAAGIKAARASAKEGDILGGATGVLLRARIVEALRQRGGDPFDLLVAASGDDDEEAAPPPVINERYSWAWPSFAPPSVIVALPDLPDALQYRFIGRDLVLVDIDANLIIDVLPDAFPLTLD